MRLHVCSYLVDPKANFDLMNLKMCSSDLSWSAFCKHEQTDKVVLLRLHTIK